MACASCMSLARCATAFRSRRCRSAASSWAPRMRPSLATKLAASSRACSTTLSSGVVVLDEADVPPRDADAPAVVPAAKAGAMEHASKAHVRVNRIMGHLPTDGRWLRGYPSPAASAAPVGRESVPAGTLFPWPGGPEVRRASCLARGNMVERDHPPPVALAHQPGID